MVVVTRDGGVARVTLNNPRRKNAITLEMAAAIEAFCDEVEADAGDRRGAGGGRRGLLLQRGRHPHPGRGARPTRPARRRSRRRPAVYRSFTRVGSLPGAHRGAGHRRRGRRGHEPRAGHRPAAGEAGPRDAGRHRWPAPDRRAAGYVAGSSSPAGRRPEREPDDIRVADGRAAAPPSPASWPAAAATAAGHPHATKPAARPRAWLAFPFAALTARGGERRSRPASAAAGALQPAASR